MKNKKSFVVLIIWFFLHQTVSRNIPEIEKSNVTRFIRSDTAVAGGNMLC
jgi:hypothetical protein